MLSSSSPFLICTAAWRGLFLLSDLLGEPCFCSTGNTKSGQHRFHQINLVIPSLPARSWRLFCSVGKIMAPHISSVLPRGSLLFSCRAREKHLHLPPVFILNDVERTKSLKAQCNECAYALHRHSPFINSWLHLSLSIFVSPVETLKNKLETACFCSD